jgi:alkylated DNA repair dioxygenase AlkB
MKTVFNQSDGEVILTNNFYSDEQSQFLFQTLLTEINWQHETFKRFGKILKLSRKVAFYADVDIDYVYANQHHIGLKWNDALLDIKQKVSEHTGAYYNACLLNLYHSGLEGMSWHSDDEKEIVKDSSIASLSLGAERIFYFKHKITKQKIGVNLSNGCLLEMKGPVQTHWLHALPKSKKITEARINLTFRHIESIKYNKNK